MVAQNRKFHNLTKPKTQLVVLVDFRIEFESKKMLSPSERNE